MSKVTKLEAAPVARNEAVVAELRGWLQMAERGELVGVILLGEIRGGTFQRVFQGFSSLVSAVGMVAIQHADMLGDIRAGETEIFPTEAAEETPRDKPPEE